MSLLKNYLRIAPQASRLQPLPFTSVPNSRCIRIKQSSDADKNPPEGHVLEHKDQSENQLDPQAQSAQGSTHAPRDERPDYVHGRLNKGDPTGGTTKQGKEDAATPSLWDRLKQKLGMGTSKRRPESGNR